MSKLLNYEELENLDIQSRNARCGLCPNNCKLTVHRFDDRRFITGNRCDKPIRKKDAGTNENLVEYKYERLFDYAPLSDEEATRGQVGLARVLNMYEHYPFWFTFFTSLKYQVIISDRSSKEIYESAMDTIPSETLCYPAKLANGHIKNLIDKGLDFIFYPEVMYENLDEKRKYSCPVVMSYGEVIKHNMDEIAEKNIRFENPFITMQTEKQIYRSLKQYIHMFDCSKAELKEAVHLAWKELKAFQAEIQAKADQVIEDINNSDDKRGIVLAMRPYHIDPEINHGIDRLISSYGFAVLTEDMVHNRAPKIKNLRVVDQWTYHARLYKSAEFVGSQEKFDLIQLNSFGCGLDAITTDQVKEILEHHNKVYTNLKIDEGENLGAAKIRVRSLKAAVEERKANQVKINKEAYDYEPVKIEGDLKDYTILAPQMSPVHFEYIEHAIRYSGYDVRLLREVNRDTIDTGLKYVNNDACYPAIVVIGQLIDAIKEYDLDNEKVALLISQTGGGCRASNYISLIRRALSEAGYEIPVISLNAGNIADENAMNVDRKMLKRMAIGLTYGDLMLRIMNRATAYEVHKGEAERLKAELDKKVYENIESGSYYEFRKNTKMIVERFDQIEFVDEDKPRVGIVGEILVKYHPTANNQLVKVIEENGGEAVVPEMLDFFLFALVNNIYRAKYINPSRRKRRFFKALIRILERYRKFTKVALDKSEKYESYHLIKHTVKNAQKISQLGNQSGEGWFLTGEMVNLIEDGVPNIICTQPFGCLPNHITGKGMFKAIREQYEDANIVAIDYDPGASEVNQVNRIKLMMSVAKKAKANEVKTSK